jgi:hypothetical protein
MTALAFTPTEISRVPLSLCSDIYATHADGGPSSLVSPLSPAAVSLSSEPDLLAVVVDVYTRLTSNWFSRMVR